jgi:ribulose kinase
VANPLLVSLYADATGREVLIPKEEDSVLLGTAAVAATAARLHPTLTDAARAMIKPGRSIKPAAATEPFFDRQYKRFMLMLDHQEALREM